MCVKATSSGMSESSVVYASDAARAVPSMFQNSRTTSRTKRKNSTIVARTRFCPNPWRR